MLSIKGIIFLICAALYVIKMIFTFQPLAERFLLCNRAFSTGSTLYGIPLFIAILPEAHVDSVSISA